MREILFRGKRKDNGEWVEGNLIQSPYMGEVRSWISTPEDKTRLRAIATYYGDWRAVEVGTDTICQYTGLTDKNRHKIWENDVVYIPYERLEDSYCKVIFRRGGFIGEMADGCEDCLLNRKIKVIGNIFDNEDLLKGE